VKTCSKCLEEKDINYFSKNKSSPDGYRSVCKVCCRKQGKTLYIKNKEELSIKRKQFYKKDGVRTRRLKKGKEWYVKNAEKTKERTALYCKRNRSKYCFYSRRWYSNNKNNKNYILSCRLRSRLCNAVKNGRKGGSAVNDLGCSIEDLKSHLESKFQPGMTWDNYGKNGWHIDHIRPLVSFDLTDADQLKQACHYTNLQPLWAHDNYVKSDKIGEEYGNKLDAKID
jgi:hypothetical protein